MTRTTRIVTTTALTLGISLAAGAPLAQAQEMDHGRTRPAPRETSVNMVKTYDQAMIAAIGNVRA